MKHYLAFDLGASSGRAILGTIDNGRISLQELHRFSNGGVAVHGGLFWNLLGLFDELKTGLRKALQAGVELSGLAIDTWGVDYAFLDRQGFPVGFPRHYRDSRTDDVMPWFFAKVSRQDIYAATGIQFMTLNTLFQLAASVRDRDPSLEIADRLLFMPNLLTYLFSGHIGAEYSIATTSQLFNPSTGDWAWSLIDALGLKRTLFPAITPPGTIVGTLLPAIQEELKCPPLPVILTGSHDTASAVAAVPATSGQSWAYLSSGTWSLLGVELDQPLLSPEAMAANYTNEGGVGGKIRFLKNIMGLWLIQECRTEWKRQGITYTFDEMDAMAAQAEPLRSFVNPNDPSFTAPGDMPGRIAAYCQKTGQPIPETPGQILRTALESLALRYRQTIDELEQITHRPITVLHLVGGGCKNEILNQFTADAIRRQVVTGPTEATALGNIAGQAIATGDLKDLQAARAIIAASTETVVYAPKADAKPWEDAYKRFLQLP
ncbi:MAG TPA: rhamnulokinase family protein [Lentisphaeria bacterium]|nr:rhamnulokinase [Lentisphaerota bacterium]HQC51704.1 rhamnulokinase family protein [Lentisphaeria bacterium]HQL87680.1 rhamnulokinase family protein [Lentisphaeria bacterium]